ncbi:MAG: MotA/TolQ/ExbB proton channel family protein [Planctomycetota bacterium]|nr:MAG: MotA/TolQ/ExbB proton channel family protein [Planctomycetota bacterium]
MMGDTMEELRSQLATLIERGGFVMVPLLFMSVVSLTLIVERACFWFTVHRPRPLRRFQQVKDALRNGDLDLARKVASSDRSPYGHIANLLINEGATDAVAVEAMEVQRPKFDRFMVSLSTIITAAPLMGILGTVVGIIRSFRILGGGEGDLTDPSVVSLGIAEALLTTALGLVVALITLFPYMIFKGQVDRAIGRVETLVAAAQQGFGTQSAGQRASVEIDVAPSRRSGGAVAAKSSA